MKTSMRAYVICPMLPEIPEPEIRRLMETADVVTMQPRPLQLGELVDIPSISSTPWAVVGVEDDGKIVIVERTDKPS